MFIVGVPDVYVPLSMVTVPDTPDDAFPLLRFTAPLVVPVPDARVNAPDVAAEFPEFIDMAPVVPDVVVVPLVILILPEFALVLLAVRIFRALVVLSPDWIVRVPVDVDQIELAPPVRVSDEPERTEVAPALADPIDITSAPVAPVPILIVSTPVPVPMFIALVNAPPAPKFNVVAAVEPIFTVVAVVSP